MACAALADFFDKLKIADYSLYPAENLIHSQTGAGQIITAEMGPRLWRGSITLAPMSHADAFAQGSLVQEMMNPGAKFAMTEKKRQHPQADPGSVIGAGSGWQLVSTSNSNGYTFGDSGRGGYKITAGDRFSYTTGTPAYGLSYHYNEFRRDFTLGNATTLPVLIRQYGALGGPQTVILKRPFLVAMIIPGSLTPFRFTPSHAEGMSFDFIQSIKG